MSLHGVVLFAIFHAVKVRTYGSKIIIGDVFKITVFFSLQYYFKMVSPTLPEISMNKQAIFEGRKQFLLILAVFESSVYTVNQ
jgi:hypothetical protein